jgi:hypothetical protein
MGAPKWPSRALVKVTRAEDDDPEAQGASISTVALQHRSKLLTLKQGTTTTVTLGALNGHSVRRR